MLKRAKSSYILQKQRAPIKKRNIVSVCQSTFDRNKIAYQNESLIKKRWLRNLLTSMLIGFGGGFSIVLNHYIRHRIR